MFWDLKLISLAQKDGTEVVKGLTAKHNYVGLIIGTHMLEGENKLHIFVL